MTKTKAKRIAVATLALLHIPGGKAKSKPTAKTESRPAAESKQEITPTTKSKHSYEFWFVQQIERLRRESAVTIRTWFTEHLDN